MAADTPILDYKRQSFNADNCLTCERCYELYMELRGLINDAPSSDKEASHKVFMDGSICLVHDKQEPSEAKNKIELHLWKRSNFSGIGFAYCKSIEHALYISSLIKQYCKLVMERDCAHKDYYVQLTHDETSSLAHETYKQKLASHDSLVSILYAVLTDKIRQEANRGSGGYNISPHHLYADGTIFSFGKPSEEHLKFTKEQTEFMKTKFFWKMNDMARSVPFIWSTDLDSLISIRDSIVRFLEIVNQK